MTKPSNTYWTFLSLYSPQDFEVVKSNAVVPNTYFKTHEDLAFQVVAQRLWNALPPSQCCRFNRLF